MKGANIVVEMTTETLKLVRKAREGDDEAFEKLLKDQYEYIYRTAYHYAEYEFEILDLIQETTSIAYQGIRKLKHDQYFYTWYIRILIRTAHKMRSKTKQIQIEDTAPLVVDTDYKNEIEQGIDLNDSFNRIERKYADVLQLYYYQDFTIQEIRNILKIPPGTVKTNLSRGKQKLKQILGGDYFEK
ncbi:sigma-70 family RNA polymerase sigma factor [Erwinia sp. CPCC 100877]|nr:sigma-70 family RNA polymerase sigma factor [Erwinia sp. CPCC 100877]